MTRLLLRRRSAAILLFLMLASCAHQIRPNALNRLDDTAYTFLRISQDSLNATRAEIAAGTMPETLLPIYNKAVDGYMTTRRVWLDYRQHKASDKDLSDALILIQSGMLELNKAIGRQP